MKQRHVCILTGKRGGFGALIPTIQAINARSDMRASLIVTDQHLYDFFGKTVNEVESLFEVSAFIDMQQQGDSNADRARAVGTCLIKATEVLSELAPDLLLVLGDRGEVLATCIAAHNLRIPIAHIQGGDISGSLDEPVRHAITKLSHIHFASTPASANRILKMGEEPERVHVVGDNHIDQLLSKRVPPPELLYAKYNLKPNEPFLIVLQHSDSSEAQNSQQHMRETIAAIESFNLRTLLIYPCSDQGYQGIVTEIEQARRLPKVSVHKNIPAEEFAGLQSIAACLIGNSSSGLIEAPYFGLPAVNIGNRQQGREHTENVLHVPYDRAQIAEAIKKALTDAAFKKRCQSIKPPFGDGQAFKKMVEIMAAVDLGPALLNKRMSY